MHRLYTFGLGKEPVHGHRKHCQNGIPLPRQKATQEVATRSKASGQISCITCRIKTSIHCQLVFQVVNEENTHCIAYEMAACLSTTMTLIRVVMKRHGGTVNAQADEDDARSMIDFGRNKPYDFGDVPNCPESAFWGLFCPLSPSSGITDH